MGIADILYILFKHRIMIIIFAIIGLGAAGTAYYLNVPMYQSDAKLLVRYVVDKSAIDPDSAAGASVNRYFEGVINSEMEILTSWDLAVEVAEKIGPEKFVKEAKGGDIKALAAHKIVSGLIVQPGRGTNVILVSFKDHDPELATQVLTEIITRYFIKHLEVHRSAGASEFVNTQIAKVEVDLSGIETALKGLKKSVNVDSLAESTTVLRTSTARVEAELAAAEAELAEQVAQTGEMLKLTGAAAAAAAENKQAAGEGKSAPAESKAATPPKEAGGKLTATATQLPPALLPTAGEAQDYSVLVRKLEDLRKTRLDLLSKYTPENQSVRLNRVQIDELDVQRRRLESKYPSLIATAPAPTTSSGSSSISSGPVRPDPMVENARAAGLKAKVDTLRSQLAALRKQSDDISEAAPQIEKLERRKAVEEANYKYFSSAGEKARIDEALGALDPSKIPNISEVEKPTPALRVLSDLKKTLMMLAGGGVGVGIALALLKDLVLDRSVKRPLELEAELQIPLMLSIPMIPVARQLQLRDARSGQKQLATTKSKGPVAPWEEKHFIRPYAEALRDRLGLYFEVNGIIHKPKLIGVAGLTEGSGSSTLAGGLAAALSETGGGKVLLVDMNASRGDVHPFFQGRPACSLSDALEPETEIPSAAENLYLASATEGDQESRVGLRGLHKLMPHLQASDFDFIIFDFPPVRQTTPTAAMAGFMDKLLFVTEAESCSRDQVKRTYSELVSNRAKVSVVFNKVRSYAPAWVEGEL